MASSNDLEERHVQDLIHEVCELKKRIKEARKAAVDTDYVTATENVLDLGRIKFKRVRTLRGHLAKVTDVFWSTDSIRLLSVAQDGRAFLWDSLTKQKQLSIALETAWITCGSLSNNTCLMASGGLDDTCSIHRLNNSSNDNSTGKSESEGQGTLVTSLTGHTNYLAKAFFLKGDQQIITASGDMTCALWDLESAKIVQKFEGHESDINSMALAQESNRYFVSCSSDQSVKLWDLRVENCVSTFTGHTLDVTGADFFPNNDLAFASSSEDASLRIWDIRADQALTCLSDPYMQASATSLAFSKSGRIIFGAYDDYNLHVWDILLEERVGIMAMHDDRVSCVNLSRNGLGIASGSWDNLVMVWSV